MTSPRSKLLTVTALVAGLRRRPRGRPGVHLDPLQEPRPEGRGRLARDRADRGRQDRRPVLPHGHADRPQGQRKSLDAYAGVLQTGTASVSTLRGGSTRYVAYMPKLRLKVGKKYAIEIVISGKTFNRTVTLKRGTAATAHGENIQA